MTTSRFQSVALHHATRLINHGPTVLITSAHGNRRDVMAAAWSMPVNFEPPQLAVVIDSSTYTRELVTAGGSFAVCVPGRDLMDVVYGVGSISGRKHDKFALYGIETMPSPNLGLPLIESGCSAWLECRVLAEPRTEAAYDTFFGEIVAAAADPRVFSNGRWSFQPAHAGLHTIHHLGGGAFAVAGDVQRAASSDTA